MRLEPQHTVGAWLYRCGHWTLEFGSGMIFRDDRSKCCSNIFRNSEGTFQSFHPHPLDHLDSQIFKNVKLRLNVAVAGAACCAADVFVRFIFFVMLLYTHPA